MFTECYCDCGNLINGYFNANKCREKLLFTVTLNICLVRMFKYFYKHNYKLVNIFNNIIVKDFLL